MIIIICNLILIPVYRQPQPMSASEFDCLLAGVGNKQL